MGRKRTGTRKYLYLSIAAMIFISLAGCAVLKGTGAERDASGRLAAAKRLLDQGNYEAALEENRKVLLLYDHAPPGDEALFHTGLIYAHSGYPKRNYKKSIDAFKRLLKVFPQSPLAGQAKLWIAILQENERLSGDIEELNKTIKKSKQVDIEIDEKKRELSK